MELATRNASYLARSATSRVEIRQHDGIMRQSFVQSRRDGKIDTYPDDATVYPLTKPPKKLLSQTGLDLRKVVTRMTDDYAARFAMLTELTKARYGVDVREDSKLADLWCSNMLPFPYVTIDDVGHELYCIQMICDNTDYKAESETLSRNEAKRIKERGVTWSVAWEIVRSHYFDCLKYQHVIDSNLKF